MKKIISIIAIMCLIFALTGCTQCISTEYENVEVNIVDKYYEESETEYYLIGSIIGTNEIPEIYEITVEYNNVEYTISGSDTYNKYKDKVGQTAIGTLQIRTYDDGSVRYDITELQ